MVRIKRKYWPFYMDGRAERRLPSRDLDIMALAKAILSKDEASLHEELHAACQVIADATLGARVKKRWLSEREDELLQAECDPEEAYQAWCAGRVAELAFAVESNLVDALSAEVFEEE